MRLFANKSSSIDPNAIPLSTLIENNNESNKSASIDPNDMPQIY